LLQAFEESAELAHTCIQVTTVVTQLKSLNQSAKF